MSVLGGFRIAQQAVARCTPLVHEKSPYQEAVTMDKDHSQIYETSCFAIVQQAVAQKVCIVDNSIGQQLVAQLMQTPHKVHFYG